MKIVINTCYGGFGLSEEAEKILSKDLNYYGTDLRTYKPLISLVENWGEKANNDYSSLRVIEIPDDITDWDLLENDGMEEIIYVRNGKIHYIS